MFSVPVRFFYPACPRPRWVLRILSSLLLGVMLLGSPPSVAAQTCTETDTAVSGISGTKVMSGSHNDIVDDCTTLLGLKDTLRGTASLNWTTTLAMSSWDGITVEGETTPRVTRLSLNRYYGNQLTGTIPDLSSLSSLHTLILNHNQLNGSLTVTHFPTSLHRLFLASNQLTGTIPDLSSLSSLSILNLSYNQLTGTIPDLSSLSSLSILNLSYNQLTGTIPDLSVLTNLGDLDLSHNNFEAGPIPSWVSSLTSLRGLHLTNTNRTGPIPDLSVLTNLYYLDLSHNNFEVGPIPSWVSSLTSLGLLDLTNTNRTGPIPDLSGLTNLHYLDLGHNTFDAGAVPSWVSNMTSLRGLHLTNTNRTGPIPDLSVLTNLHYLDLGHNTFDAGAVPSWVSNTSLEALILTNTNRTGPIPDLSGLNLYYLDLSHNNFEAGPIPSWVSSLTSLEILILTNTNRTGPIPDLSGLNLWDLDLSFNELTGRLPSTLGDLTDLYYLDLSHNNLSGPIPSTLGNLTKLKKLYIFSGNDLSGSLPPGLPSGLETDLSGRPGDIQSLFESPADGTVVSGIDVIRGWSFAEEVGVGIRQVELYLDGQRTAVIPCCSTRDDVAGDYPSFPVAHASQSGWGMTWNWGTLEAGAHTIRVVATSTVGGRWDSGTRTITVVKPGGIAYASEFSLAEANARLAGSQLVLDGVVMRDSQTQAEQEVALRYAWQTGAQGLRLVTSQPMTTARGLFVGVERLLAQAFRWGQRVFSPTSVTANEGITAFYEAPGNRARVAGIGLIRGWAFPNDPTDAIASVTVQIGDTLREDAPCCSTRPDVAGEYPEAADSGWGLVFNYGNLLEGEHNITVHIETEAGVVAPPETHTVTTSRLGGYAFVDRFDLRGAEVALVGEEIILSGVQVRDSQTQAWETIEVRLRWARAAQGLVIVDTEIMP